MNKNLSKKVKIVVAKITTTELDVFKSFGYEKLALIDCLGLIEKNRLEFWKKIKKDYKIEGKKRLLINQKTREIFYEDFK